jgi:hypothetical protein
MYARGVWGDPRLHPLMTRAARHRTIGQAARRANSRAAARQVRAWLEASGAGLPLPLLLLVTCRRTPCRRLNPLAFVVKILDRQRSSVAAIPKASVKRILW